MCVRRLMLLSSLGACRRQHLSSQHAARRPFPAHSPRSKSSANARSYSSSLGISTYGKNSSSSCIMLSVSSYRKSYCTCCVPGTSCDQPALAVIKGRRRPPWPWDASPRDSPASAASRPHPPAPYYREVYAPPTRS